MRAAHAAHGAPRRCARARVGRRDATPLATRRSRFTRAGTRVRPTSRAPPASASATGSPTAPSRSRTGRISTSRATRRADRVRARGRHRGSFVSRYLDSQGGWLDALAACSASPTLPRAVRVVLALDDGTQHRALDRAAMTPPPQRARGAALILAMLLAALAAVVAVTLARGPAALGATVEHRRDQVQAQALAMAGVQWARADPRRGRAHSSIDHLGEPWALPLPPTPLENGAIAGRSSTRRRASTSTHWAREGIGANAMTRAPCARCSRGVGRAPLAALDAIAGLDRRRRRRARRSGAEDAYYARPAGRRRSRRTQPVAARRRARRRARACTPAALAALAPFLTALPRQRTVNVNTAPPEVLAAIARRPRPAIRAPRSSRVARKSRSRRSPSSAPACRQGATLRGERRARRSAASYFLVDHRRATGQHARDRPRAAASQCRRMAARSSGRWSTSRRRLTCGDPRGGAGLTLFLVLAVQERSLAGAAPAFGGVGKLAPMPCSRIAR